MMSDNTHDRALKLLAQSRIEGVPETDSTWLRTHLEECDFCTEHARQTDRALRVMRTAAIALPEGLASRTQFRVRLRAQELREREPKRRAMWLACAVSWAFGIASAPYVWRLFQWFGERTGVPKLVWELGFGLWWTIPAIFFVFVVLMEKMGHGSESEWMRQSR
jgi:predicted anti-sigma-YlaC factor YlaD